MAIWCRCFMSVFTSVLGILNFSSSLNWLFMNSPSNTCYDGDKGVNLPPIHLSLSVCMCILCVYVCVSFCVRVSAALCGVVVLAPLGCVCKFLYIWFSWLLSGGGGI